MKFVGREANFRGKSKGKDIMLCLGNSKLATLQKLSLKQKPCYKLNLIQNPIYITISTVFCWYKCVLSVQIHRIYLILSQKLWTCNYFDKNYKLVSEVRDKQPSSQFLYFVLTAQYQENPLIIPHMCKWVGKQALSCTISGSVVQSVSIKTQTVCAHC